MRDVVLFSFYFGSLRAQRRLKGVEEFEFERISPQAMEEHVPSLHVSIYPLRFHKFFSLFRS